MKLRATLNRCARGKSAQRRTILLQEIRHLIGSGLVVAKTGTGFSCSEETYRLRKRHIKKFVKTLPESVQALVVSGAVCTGMGIAKLSEKPPAYSQERRDLARDGQAALTEAFRHACAPIGLNEHLYTLENLKSVTDHFKAAQQNGHLLFVNAEESADHMNKDNHMPNNDFLAAELAIECGAKLLIIISNTAFYDRNPSKPGAKMIREITQMTPEIWNAAQGTNCQHATGGMATKLEAAGIAARHGIPTIIINGLDPECLEKLSRGCYDEFTYIHARAFDGFNPQPEGAANENAPALAA